MCAFMLNTESTSGPPACSSVWTRVASRQEGICQEFALRLALYTGLGP